MNALSLAKLGIGFGALAVASIGLLKRQDEDQITPQYRAGSSGLAIFRTVPRDDSDSDDDELLLFALLA